MKYIALLSLLMLVTACEYVPSVRSPVYYPEKAVAAPVLPVKVKNHSKVKSV